MNPRPFQRRNSHVKKIVSDNSDNLLWLQRWYRTQTNGRWERQHGIKISTIDNPGWRVGIHLSDTTLSAKSFDRVEIKHSDIDWIHCWVEKDKFEIACGPLSLHQGIGIFRSWAESSS